MHMKKKLIIIFIVIIIFLFLLVFIFKNMIYAKYVQKFKLNKLSEQDSTLTRICNGKDYKFYLDELKEGHLYIDYLDELPGRVLRCGDYYRAKYSETAIDEPDIVSGSGNERIRCDGMPVIRYLSPQTIPEQCNIACDNENLCVGIDIGIYCWMISNTSDRDDCYLHTSVRKNNKKYCYLIKDGYFRKGCLSYDINAPFDSIYK